MAMFGERLAEAVRVAGNTACIGLDPHPGALPAPLRGATSFRAQADSARRFCLGVLAECAGRVPAVKPQTAFFEALGAAGVEALEAVVAAARSHGLVVIVDAKRGDIGSTAEAYARATLDPDGPLGADAVTVSPYLGPESLTPFLDRCDRWDKGLFVLLRTSNAGAAAWQQHVAPSIAEWIEAQNQPRVGASGFGPVGAVVGATLPAEAAAWRSACPRTWFLAPGVGAQGATPADVTAQHRSDGLGALVVSARGVLFPAQGFDGEDWPMQVRRRVDALRAAVAWPAGAARGNQGSGGRP